MRISRKPFPFDLLRGFRFSALLLDKPVVFHLLFCGAGEIPVETGEEDAPPAAVKRSNHTLLSFHGDSGVRDGGMEGGERADRKQKKEKRARSRERIEKRREKWRGYSSFFHCQ